MTRHNAGGFGTNNSGPGGLGTDIADDSGLWQVVAGGRFNDDANAPNFNGTPIQDRDHIIAWRYPAPHTGNQILDVYAFDVDLIYDYTMDTRDLNGGAPGSTSEKPLTMSFFYCPTDSDDGFTDNVLSLGIRDEFDQSLLEFGITGDNKLQYRVGNASLWQTTSTSIGTQGWSQIIMTVDAFDNTVSFSAVPWSDTNGYGPQEGFITAVSLGINASSLEKLRWSTECGIFDTGSGAVAYKNTFDDFAINVVTVPEPGSALLLALSVAFFMCSRP